MQYQVDELHSVALVAVELAPHITGDPPMLIGAAARDLIHGRRGHEFSFTATQDIDVSLAIRDWAAYRKLVSNFTPLGDSGIRHRVAGFPVDLMPFGDLESPVGTLFPPWRERDPIDVFAMGAVYQHADELHIPGLPGRPLRIPTPAGYTCLKLKAWIDRSERSDTRDAPDLGLAIFWHLQDDGVHVELWEERPELLERHDFDLELACADVLGERVRAIVGKERATMLAERALNGASDLARGLAPRSHAVRLGLGDEDRRRLFVSALLTGLTS